MSDSAPVALFVYRRPRHARSTLNALAANAGAERTDLIVFADAAPEDASPELEASVRAVREVIAESDWPGSLTLRERVRHQGLARSLIDGITEVLDAYGRVVVLEDDLLTAPYFLDFMNRCLSHYSSATHVFGIGAHPLVESESLPETYLLPVGSSWGWATWERAWRCLEEDATALLHEIRTRNLRDRFDFGGYPYCAMLESQARGELDSWAIRFYASYFLRDGYFLFPRRSLVKNIGLDGSGTHDPRDKRFARTLDSQWTPVDELATRPDDGVIERASELFARKLGSAKNDPRSSSVVGRLRNFFEAS